MTVYDQMRKALGGLVQKYGVEMTLTKVTQFEYDPFEGASPDPTTSNETFTAFVYPAVTNANEAGKMLRKPFEVVAGDLIVLLKEGAITSGFELEDVIATEDGIEWVVVGTYPPYAGEMVVARQLLIRKKAASGD